MPMTVVTILWGATPAKIQPFCFFINGACIFVNGAYISVHSAFVFF